MTVKFVNEPQATLIGSTVVDEYAIKRVLEAEGFQFDTDAETHGDYISEFAGRTCYLSYDPGKRRKQGQGQNRAYIEHILEVDHTSVFEHAVFNFLITDFSKNCTQELVRHRVGLSPSVQSSRYVDPFDESKLGPDAIAYMPPRVADHPMLSSVWEFVWKQAASAYRLTKLVLANDGVGIKDATGDARHILPGGLCNWLVITVNARALHHLFDKRGNSHADMEIRALAVALFRQVQNNTLFCNWHEFEDEKGVPFLMEALDEVPGDAQ